MTCADGVEADRQSCLIRSNQLGADDSMSILNTPFDPAREAALVTGAGNGIGRAIAQALVGEGVRTVFADVNPDTVAAAIKTSPRPELAVPWVGDLADRGACDALLAHAQSAVGRVTHFVHSASPPRREADHAMAVSDETWEQMHAVNVDAGFHLARELARPLIAAESPARSCCSPRCTPARRATCRTTRRRRRRSRCW